MNNSLAQATQKPKFSVVLQSDAMKNLINNTLGDKETAKRFVAAITSAVAQNSELQKCDPKTIISAGLVGEALKLSPSSVLGQYYLVPYANKKENKIDAQFQLGYLGLLQLALRSNQIVDIDVKEIREGEVVGRDSETGKYKFKFIEDESIRESKDIIGYMAYVELKNGFKKTVYWSKEKMEAHALQYSQGYKSDKRNGTSYTFWSKNFTEMAFKTILRYLVKKWCPLSIELIDGITKDQAVIDENNNAVYVDNAEDVADTNDTPVDPVYAQYTNVKTKEEKTVEVVEEDAPAPEYPNGLFDNL